MFPSFCLKKFIAFLYSEGVASLKTLLGENVERKRKLLRRMPVHKRNQLLTGDAAFPFDPVAYDLTWNYPIDQNFEDDNPDSDNPDSDDNNEEPELPPIEEEDDENQQEGPDQQRVEFLKSSLWIRLHHQSEFLQ